MIVAETKDPFTPAANSIRALVPRGGAGHQFACYADSCSGVPGGPHEATFAAVNAVVARLSPQPEFICFPGDEIRGLTVNREELQCQWRYWLQQEMSWLDRQRTPLYHTTGNHTTYDAASEAVFRQMLAHLPDNGPPGQEGLSYFVRRDDLLLVFVNTNWSGLGGEGRVETAWLDQTLARHADARYKLVLGHHPVYPVNGFSGAYQREIEAENGVRFWQVLVRHRALAYLCSHMLAFDVQVHDGVLQIMTAGAGTAPLMPEGVEYHHCLQAALDAGGLRYQVLDTAGQVREWLTWPLTLPPSADWLPLTQGEHSAAPSDDHAATKGLLTAWRFSGLSSPGTGAEAQTLLCGRNPGAALTPLWIGLLGGEQRLGVLLSPAPGRSPHLWHGPTLPPGEPFCLQVAIHAGMGPGGLLWRRDDKAPWSSLAAASPWGAERLAWPERWSVGYSQRGPDDRPFRGGDLRVTGSRIGPACSASPFDAELGIPLVPTEKR
jgi:hypothetical protein